MNANTEHQTLPTPKLSDVPWVDPTAVVSQSTLGRFTEITEH